MGPSDPLLGPRPSGLVPGTRCVPRARLLLGLVLLVALALRLVSFGDPWSGLPHDFHSHFGAFATGGQATQFLDTGVLELDAHLTNYRVVLADGAVFQDLYTHHPPLFVILEAWSLELFGRTEWALRLVPLCFSLLSILGAWRLGRLVWGERVGLLMAALLAVVPWSAWYGVQTFSEGALIWVACEETRRYVLWLRTGSWRHLGVAALWQLLAGLLDWPGGFLLLGLGLHGLFIATRTRGLRGLLSLLVLPGAFLVAVAVHWLHMGVGLGEAGREHDTARTLATVTTLTTDLGHFLSLQLRFLLRFLGTAVALLFAFGLLRFFLRVRRLSDEDWLALVLLVPGLLYVGLFPQRSVNHDFFFMLALPGIAVLASGALLALLDERRRAPSALIGPLVLLAVLGSAAWRTVAVWQERRSDQLELLVDSPWLAPLLADGDGVVLAHIGRGMGLPFYARAQVVYSVDTAARFEELEGALLERLQPGRPAWFLFDLATDAQLASAPVDELLAGAGLAPDLAGVARARALEELLTGLPQEQQRALLQGLLTPELAELYGRVRAAYPGRLHVVPGSGLYELVDLTGVP